jgi:hypothetical protein
VANPDPEVRSNKTVQSHVVYPSTRPGFWSRICCCWECTGVGLNHLGQTGNYRLNFCAIGYQTVFHCATP